MISAVVFSRDRAMQLDLLLRSLDRNGGRLFGPKLVIYRATSADHDLAYVRCQDEHPDVLFVGETHTSLRLAAKIGESADFGCCLTDDSVLYRTIWRPDPCEILARKDVTCFSLRLGENTTWCYPHGREQRRPAFESGGGVNVWEWSGADGDFGYAGSLDGHVFGGQVLRLAFADVAPGSNPNQIEDQLVRTVAELPAESPKMASYPLSHLVGIPVNRVNETHGNRFGERHGYAEGDLLERYLRGQRIALDRLDFSDVRGAHQEIPLVFEGR